MLSATSSMSSTARINGAWTLAPGSAVALKPTEDGNVRILNGGVWATLDGPHEGIASTPRGDLHLQTGEVLALRSGQRVVLEPLISRRARPTPKSEVKFDWVPHPRFSATQSWEQAVVRPADDLGRALSEARLAFGRLVRGLFTWGGELVTPRRSTTMACDSAAQGCQDV